MTPVFMVCAAVSVKVLSTENEEHQEEVQVWEVGWGS